MGHVRNYSIGDVVARFKKMDGYNVLHPMGFDPFSLPAENAAIQHGIHPSKWTLGQYPRDGSAAERARSFLRLGQMGRDLPRRLQMDAVDIHSVLQERVAYKKEKSGQLVSKLSDRTGQRTGTGFVNAARRR